MKAIKKRTLPIDTPDSFEIEDRDARLLLASRLYEQGRLTLGQAAQMVGLTKRTFMELLGDYGVSIINQSLSDIEEDIHNAQNHNL